jgi:hypothetical protein
MTYTTKNMKTTNFKLLQPEVVAALLAVFQQIDKIRASEPPKKSA